MDDISSHTIYEGSLRDLFSGLLRSAAQNQRASVSPFALHYLTDVLVAFQESARLFVQEGVRVPVLVDMLNEALTADLHRRMVILQQLGDTSLVVSGFFPEALSKRSVSLNYYKKMGEIAFWHLSSLKDDGTVFDELSEQFPQLTGLISEVAEETTLRDASVMRLLSYYRDSGSERVVERLKKLGIVPLRRRPAPFE